MPLKSPLLLLFLWLLMVAAYGQETFTLTPESLANGQAVELDKLGWKYSPNDDPRFADPQFDDSAWASGKNFHCAARPFIGARPYQWLGEIGR